VRGQLDERGRRKGGGGEGTYADQDPISDLCPLRNRSQPTPSLPLAKARPDGHPSQYQDDHAEKGVKVVCDGFRLERGHRRRWRTSVDEGADDELDGKEDEEG
jgi:hypothetical protein